MAGSRLALVANDQRLGGIIQAHLRKTLGQSSNLCDFESVRDCLGQDTDGLLLLATASAEDAEPLVRLVQEIYLQKWPPIVILVEGQDDGRESGLTRLDPYIYRRLSWPHEATTLVNLVKERLGRCRSFSDLHEESLLDALRQRLLAQTPSLLPLVDRIALAASHDVTVLLTGETGTGKTFLARLMHDFSDRNSERFLAVPCGALAANLVESEFFGHAKGAFTGADRAKVGKFAAAGRGTLLLDEIDALGLEQQANLLRVIETGEYEPVGCNETHYSTARIIVASNWNLEEAVERGKFRRDLYYRLNVMSFHLPPLRERKQDIGPLVRGMTAKFNRKFKKDLFDISAEAMNALMQFHWPGNIRQLENVIQQAVLVSKGPLLLAEHLPPQVQEHGTLSCGEGPVNPNTLAVNREMSERNLIQRALLTNRYSRANAAKALGISRVTLYKKMKKYNLMSIPLQTVQAQ